MSKKATLHMQLEELCKELDWAREDLASAGEKLLAEQQKVKRYKEENGRLQ